MKEDINKTVVVIVGGMTGSKITKAIEEDVTAYLSVQSETHLGNIRHNLAADPVAFTRILIARGKAHAAKTKPKVKTYRAAKRE